MRSNPFLVAVLGSAFASHLPIAQAATACNGNAALCDRKFSNVSLIGSHDSAFVGTSLFDNQDISVTDQLDSGIRFLQGQTHNNLLGQLSLCHTSCLLEDAGTLESYLTTVKTWLDSNTNEVLMLLLTNGDYLDVSNFGDAFTASGITEYTYTPPSNPLAIDDWPTLQELITAGTRLVVFLDYDADITSVPYILPEFSYFFETPYDWTNATFDQCTLDRPSGSTGEGLMYIVNHFLDVDLGDDILVPDRDAAATTNAATGEGSIGAQAALCEGIWGRKPTRILVDWEDLGDVFAAQDALNGL